MLSFREVDDSDTKASKCSKRSKLAHSQGSSRGSGSGSGSSSGSSRGSGSSSSSSSSSSSGIVDTWSNEFSPTAVADVAMAAAKMNKISDWMLRALSAHKNIAGVSGGRPFILGLCGISGCCKSTAVEILCKNLGYELIVWSDDLLESDSIYDGYNPVTKKYNNNYNTANYIMSGCFSGSSNKGIRELVDLSSRSNSLDSFVSQSRYPTLQLTSSKAIDSNDSCSSQSYVTNEKPRIVLMHDPPAFDVSNEESMASLISRFRDPVIIIISTQTEGQDDAFFAVESLLPKKLRERINFESIYCNPISKTKSVKALTRILSPHNYNTANCKPLLEEISVQSMGDLRNAIVLLQMNAIDSRHLKESASKAGKSCNKHASSTTSKEEEEEDGGSGSRSQLFSPLYGIAKLTNARLNSQGYFKFDPDRVIEKCDFSNEVMADFIQYNMFASIDSSCRQASYQLPPDNPIPLIDVTLQFSAACQHFSDIDLFISNKYDTNAQLDRSGLSCYPDEYIAAIACRASGVSRGSGMLELFGAGAGRGYKFEFMPMHRPISLDIGHRRTLMKKKIQQLREDISAVPMMPLVNDDSFTASPCRLCISELTTTYIPYIRLMMNHNSTVSKCVPTAILQRIHSLQSSDFQERQSASNYQGSSDAAELASREVLLGDDIVDDD